jgi:non-canonical purine NTP pyrophosphatase (RdgB/HAM1 family)
MEELYDIAKRNNIPVHLDGARIFNAASYLNVDACKIAQYADSVMFCLSKGLCAPIGSMLAGTKTFIEAAKRKRKILGGGMRQVGILAQAGIIALEKMTKRVNEDHEQALYLAKLLKEMEGILDRRARFRTVIALIVDGKPFFFEGLLNGKIAEHPSGTGGFGYDPVFIPDGYDRTLAELSPEEKNLISHRGNSLRKLSAFLNQYKK